MRYLSPSKLPRSSPSVTACAAAGAPLAFARQKREPLHRTRLQIAHRGGGQSPQFRRAEFFALARADQQHALRGDSRSEVHQRHLEHLAGQFAGWRPACRERRRRPDRVRQSRPRRLSLLFLGFEYVTDQRLGLDFRRRPIVQRDLHARCPSSCRSTPPVFVHRVIHFAPCFLFAFGLRGGPNLSCRGPAPIRTWRCRRENRCAGG